MPGSGGRVLLVDARRQLSRVFRRALERAGWQVIVGEDAEVGLELAATGGARVIVVELDDPPERTLEVLGRLRGWSEAPVLVIGRDVPEWLVVDLLEGGADDVLSEPFGSDQLSARVRALERRPTATVAPQQVMHFGPMSVDLRVKSLRRDGVEVRLTPTEWRLLELLVGRPGVLLSHHWLLQHAWDESHGDETRDALRAHIRSLRAKLGDSATNPSYIRTESGTGYRWIALPSVTADVHPWEQGSPDVLRLAGEQALVHELNSTLSSVRLAVYLVRAQVETSDDGAGPDSPGSEVAESFGRLEALLTRVAAYAVELERRAAGQPADGELVIPSPTKGD